MTTAADDYYDDTVKDQIDLRAYQAGLVSLFIKKLEITDRETVALLREALPEIVASTPFNPNGQKWKKLISTIAAKRSATIDQISSDLIKEMQSFAKAQAKVEIENLDNALRINVIKIHGVPDEQLEAVAIKKPFSSTPEAANTLEGFFNRLKEVDQGRLEDAIRSGIIRADSVQDIVQKVAGTKAQGFANGILAASRRNAEAIVRTGVSGVSNAARELVWAANADIATGVLWVSVLDGRTSAVCRARDNHAAPLGNHPIPPGFPPLVPDSVRPPAHVNCRSTTVMLFNNEGIDSLIGDRPFVRSTKTGQKRNVEFRAIARDKVGKEAWHKFSRSQRNALTNSARKEWNAANIGQVPQRLSYGEWLKKQSPEFQNEVLGPSRAALFRNGQLAIDEFVDKKGHELNLAQLMERIQKRRKQ